MWTVLVDTLNIWTATLSNLEEMHHPNKLSSQSYPEAENLCHELDYKELKLLYIFNFFLTSIDHISNDSIPNKSLSTEICKQDFIVCTILSFIFSREKSKT